MMENKIHNESCLETLAKMTDESVDLVFADPPFDVNIKYKGYKDKRVDYNEWCSEWIAECFRVLKPTGSFYLMTITRHLPNVLNEMSKHGEFVNLISWKNVASMETKRSFKPHSQPIVFYGKTDERKFDYMAQTRKNDFQRFDGKGKKDGQLYDYWDDIPFVYAGSIRHKEAILENGTKRKAHPCQMPEMLAGRCILFSTDEGDLVYDPFMGSGTTAIAAKKLNRRWIGSDISPDYVKLANERIERAEWSIF